MRAFFSSRSDQLPTRQSQRITLFAFAAVAGSVFHPDPPHWGHSLDTQNSFDKKLAALQHENLGSSYNVDMVALCLLQFQATWIDSTDSPSTLLPRVSTSNAIFLPDFSSFLFRCIAASVRARGNSSPGGVVCLRRRTAELCRIICPAR